MFLSFPEYVDYLADKLDDTPSESQSTGGKIRTAAIQQIKADFGIALSSVYRMLQDPGYYVFIDYANKQSRILRTSGKCDFTR